MKTVAVVLCVVVLAILAVQVGPVAAVGADETGLGFDQQGQKIVGSARNVWVPVLVVVGIIGYTGAEPNPETREVPSEPPSVRSDRAKGPWPRRVMILMTPPTAFEP